MSRTHTLVLAALLFPPGGNSAEPAFAGAEGFGALSRGGKGGRVLTVTRLKDDEREGSLRWAVAQAGPREVRFAVGGTLRLHRPLVIENPFLTLNGSDAPGGITLRDHPLEIRDTHDVVVRHLRVRLGDWAVLKRVAENGWDRHRGSDGLDCVNIDRSREIILDHLSLFWSTDELISVTRSRNVTVQWCLLAEPLSNPRAHPYGNNHAFCANNSASTLTYHHCLFAHYVMRGPQFEANDMDRDQPFDAKFEAVNNLMFGFSKAGSKYRTGFEKPERDRIDSVSFHYHFVGNRYLNRDRRVTEIEADDRFGTAGNIRVHWSGNVGSDGSGDPGTMIFTGAKGQEPLGDHPAALAQVSDRPLFAAPVPVTVEPAEEAAAAILTSVGCSLSRDEHDLRILREVAELAPTRIVRSQEEVGGWESWKGR